MEQPRKAQIIALHALTVTTYLQPMKKRTSTREVWPWSYLVPWMEADISQRQANPGSNSADPYDNGLYMPLHDFIEEPIVKDLLHNGAALQVRCAFRAVILYLLHLLMHHAFQTLARTGPDENNLLRSAGSKQMAGIAWHACSLMHLCPTCHCEGSLSQAIFCHLRSVADQTVQSTVSACDY